MRKIYTVLFLSVMAFSCSSEGFETPSTLPVATKSSDDDDEEVIYEGYDQEMMYLAVAIGLSIRENPDFRSLIHEEALLQVDGDYDILLKSVSPSRVLLSDDNIKPNWVTPDITVRDLLDSYLPQEEVTRSEGLSSFDRIINKYPNLQISVPVHAETWHSNSYVPAIAIIPNNFEDGVTESVLGYDKDLNLIDIDALTEPTKPVIVIGTSERVDEDGNLVYNPPGVTTYARPPAWEVPKPNTPTDLKAQVWNTSINLTWKLTGNAKWFCICRKGSGESKYSCIFVKRVQSVKAEYSYEDFGITGNQNYSYYVIAVNSRGTVISRSEWSNIVYVKSPSLPDTPSYFKADLIGNNVELSWNNDGDNVSDLVVDYLIPRDQTQYTTLATMTNNENYYIYNSLVKGTRIKYRAYRRNNLGISDVATDYIYPPYRNVDSPSGVYVKQIYVDDLKGVESWVRGRPEFYLKVVGSDKAGKAYEIQDQIDFRFKSRSRTSQIFKNRKLTDWEYNADKLWYSSLTFYLQEWDTPSREAEFSATTTVNHKTEDDLTITSSNTIKVKFDHKGQLCGSSYINYYENPEKWIHFPKYGARILLSENP